MTLCILRVAFAVVIASATVVVVAEFLRAAFS